MDWDTTFLRSKVARRIFTLFILCALLPIGLLAALSFREVTRQLDQQSRVQLRETSRAEGMNILERLSFLEAALRMISVNRTPDSRSTSRAVRAFSSDVKEQFDSLAVLPEFGKPEAVFGTIGHTPIFTAEERTHLRSGMTVLTTESCAEARPCVWMAQALDASLPESGVLAGQVNLDHLLAAGALTAETQEYVLDAKNRLLFSSSGAAPEFSPEVTNQMNHTTAGQLSMRGPEGDYVGEYWTAYMKPRYVTPRWVVVVVLSRAGVLAPLASFKRIFPLVTLLAIWVVLFLSLIQIRRSLVPLEKLREGTHRIAARDFQSRVHVNSGDEFQELATSFNTMAAQLGRQFRALESANEIDRAILSSWDTEKIVQALFARLPELLPVETVSLTLLKAGAPLEARTYQAGGSLQAKDRELLTPLTKREIEELCASPEARILEARGETLTSYLEPLGQRGMRSFVVLPTLLNGQLSGILTLGYSAPPSLTSDDMFQLRQVADQIAVALSNARLIEELEQLSDGTLKALARAIDAKSPWTAGHSERVTNMAVQIGRQMGLSPREAKVLYRGGLLHDIGKIGVPNALLDKPGRLSSEEFSHVKDHVRLGARILEPIQGFAELLPIVLYHHERYDGTGYPDGLAGEEIPLHARIFAVADVFDALISDRPYRAGMPREEVVNYMQEKAGSQFDPKVVAAFVESVAQEKPEPNEALAPDLVAAT